jgi:predicted permease
MDTLLRDLRFAFRLMSRTPGVSLATILTLALGVGLNAGVFTILNGMLFRARVTVEPVNFVRVQAMYSGRAPRHESSQLTTADYFALRTRATTLQPLAAWAVAHVRVGPEARDALTLLVSCNFFETYGLDRVERGRTFRADECEAPGAAVAVISDHVWRRQFGADSDVLGKPLRLNGQPFDIVGIAPPEFAGRVRGEGIWVPFTNQPALMRGPALYDDPEAAWLWVEGRLRSGVSREAATAELSVLVRQQDDLSPGRTTTIALNNGAFIHEPAVARFAVFLVPLVLGSVGLVLLIACGNVALLLLSRAVSRRREIAVRLAIGCGRARLIRMLLTESVLFAALGVPLSIWIAREAPHAMRALIPAMPFYPMEPDMAVFGYLAAVSLTAGIAAGLTPALESLRQRLGPALGGSDPLSGVSRSRNTLIAAQIAMSLVLLAGTALFLRVEQALRASDPTVDAAHVLVANYDPPRSAPATLYAQTTARLAALPGVRSVAYARGSSGEVGDGGTALSVRGASSPARRVAVNVVSASYFETLDRRIVQGRALREGDGVVGAARVVVSEALAREWWPRGGAVGAFLETPDHGLYEVVGVVHGDLSLRDAGSFDPMQAYVMAPPNPSDGQLLLRFDGDFQTLQAAVRDTLKDLGPASSSWPTTLEAANTARAATFMPLVDMVGTLGVTAVVLALVGIYGVVSFAVGRRTREIGLRMALGATRRDIMRLIVSSGTRPILAGLAGGFVLVIPAAIALSRVFARTPVPLHAGDPLPYLAVGAMLGLAALLTMIVPARRAAAVSPSISLRSE